MRWFAIFLLFGVAACGKQADPPVQQHSAKAAPVAKAASKSMAAGKQGMAMSAMIPIPRDKAQLDRMLAMGYTVHQDHMHPPGVKECAFDKGGGSVVQ